MSDGVLLTFAHGSQAEQPSRGSKTVEELLTDGNEYEVCDLEYEIRAARRVQLQWGVGRVVPLPW